MGENASETWPDMNVAAVAAAPFPIAAARSTDFRPPTIPDHELLHLIGRGSYGEVWLARTALGSLRAVKVVYRKSFDHDRPYEREFEGLKKFEPFSHARESQVDIFHVGRNNAAGFFYYIMELADDAKAMKKEEGRMQKEQPPRSATPVSSFFIHPSSLAQYTPRTVKHDLRTRGALPVAECVQIARSLTRALEHLHAHGLVHRDIKPSNIIFVNGVPKLADIGLVTSVDATRSFVGTDGYIPPEGPGAPAGDIYSLGKVLYELITGKGRLDFPELPADWRTRPDFDQLLEFNEIVTKACDPEPSQRYQSAAEMRTELEVLQHGESVKTKRRSEQRWVIGKKIAAAGALLGVLVLSSTFLWLEFRKARPHSSNHKAERLYEEATYLFQSQTPETVREAYTNLTEAVRLDPRFVDAHYRLFEIYMDRWGENLPPNRDRGANMLAVAATLRELNPNSAQYHTANSWLKFNDWQFDDAIAEARLAIQIDPKFLRAHSLYGRYMILRGDVKTARQEFEAAADIDASDIRCQGHLASVFYYERKFDKAIELWIRAHRLEPRTPAPRSNLGQAYEAMEQYEKAIGEYEAYDKAYSDDPARTEANYQQQRSAFNENGPRGWWQTKLDQMKQSPSPDLYEMAKICARLGDTNEAFRLLESSYERHNGTMVALLYDDCWDSLRSDPRFQALVKKMGLTSKR